MGPSSPKTKGKRRAASLLSPSRFADEVIKRLKRDPASTPCPSASHPPLRTTNPPASQASDSNAAASQKGHLSAGRENDAFANDKRIETLLRKALGQENVKDAIASLVEESFTTGTSTAHPQPGRSFLEDVIKYLRQRLGSIERHTQLATRLQQQWRSRLAAFLAETVTEEDEAKDIIRSFGQHLSLASSHNGFSLSTHVEAPTVVDYLGYLARCDPTNAMSTKGTSSKALKPQEVKQASRKFRDFAQQLRLISGATAEDEAQCEGDREKFWQLKPKQQRQWFRLCKRNWKRHSLRSGGSPPWRLILEQDIPNLLEIDVNTRLMTSAVPTIAGYPPPDATNASTPVNSTSSRRATGPLGHSSASSIKASSTLSSDAPSSQGAVPSASSHRSGGPSTTLSSPLPPPLSEPRVLSADGTLPAKLKKPSASTTLQLHDYSRTDSMLVWHKKWKCPASKSVLFTLDQPGKPETDVSPAAIHKACQSTLSSTGEFGYARLQQVAQRIDMAVFKKPGCAEREVGKVLRAGEAALIAERVFRQPPDMFSADVSTFDVSMNEAHEAESQVARSLRKVKHDFTFEWSTHGTEAQKSTYMVIRFSTSPGLQCFFVPMRHRDRGAPGEEGWAWFRPLDPKVSIGLPRQG